MFMRRLLLLFVFAALGPAACVSPQDEQLTWWEKLSEKGYTVGDQVRRVQNYRLNGWSYVDERHVIFESGVSDHYLVTLRTDCRDLKSATTIAFSTTIGSLTDKDRLIVRAPGDFTNYCLIDSLHELNKAERLVEDG